MDEILKPLFDDLDFLAEQPLYPQETMIGEFRIVERIGRGGCGEVYEAENTAYCRFVALKFGLDLGGSSDRPPVADATAFDATAPLLEEIRSAVTLNLPNFITVYALRSGQPIFNGQVGCAVSFIEMELAAGRSLRDWAGDPRLTLRQAIEWLIPVAESIHRAHELGLIHYDLKPHNILLVDPQPGARFDELNPRTLVPKVSDFGLARMAGDGRTPAGTPGFAPPEQCDPALDVLTGLSRRAAIDGFALAATTYAMFDRDAAGNPMETGPGPRGSEPYSLPNPQPLRDAGADADLVAVLLKQLDPDPRRRYETVKAFAADLQRWLDGEAVAARHFLGGFRKAFRRLPWWVKVGAALLLVAIGGGLWFWADGQKKAEEAANARADVAETNRTLDHFKIKEANDRVEMLETQQKLTEQRRLTEVVRTAGQKDLAHTLLVGLARSSARRADWRTAKRDYDKAIAEGIGDVRQLRIERLAVYFGLNDVRALHEELTELEKSPELGHLAAAIKLARGTLLMCDSQLVAKGREMLLVADKLAPGTPKEFFSDADRAYTKALLENGPNPLIRALQRAVDLDPLHQSAQNSLLFALIASGQVEDGKRKLVEVERLFPNSLVAPVAHGLLAAIEGDPGRNTISIAVAEYELRKGQPAPAMREFLELYADAIDLAVQIQNHLGPATRAEQQKLDNLLTKLEAAMSNANGPLGLAVPTIQLVKAWCIDVMTFCLNAHQGGDDAYDELLKRIRDYPDAALRAVAVSNRFVTAYHLMTKPVDNPVERDRVIHRIPQLMAHVAEHAEKAWIAPTLVERSSTKYVARNLGLLADLYVLRQTPDPAAVHFQRLRTSAPKIVADARSQREWTAHREMSLQLLIQLLTVELPPAFVAEWKLDTQEGAEAWRRRGQQLYVVVRGVLDAWADEGPDKPQYQKLSGLLEKWATAEGLRANAPPIAPAPRTK